MESVAEWTRADLMTALADWDLARDQRPGEDIGLTDRTTQGHSVSTWEQWTDPDRKLTVQWGMFSNEEMEGTMVGIYPTTSPEKLPVFVAEWLTTPNDLPLVLLDVQIAGPYPVLRDELGYVLGPVGTHWQTTFPRKEAIPIGFEQIAEAWGVLSSASSQDHFSIRRMFREYLVVTLETFYIPQLPHTQGGPDHANVRRYKEHYWAVSPWRLTRQNGDAQAEPEMTTKM